MNTKHHGEENITRREAPPIKIELLYFDGCPGYGKADQTLRAAPQVRLPGTGSREAARAGARTTPEPE
jgi:hypothetical protein